jgi:hypothetical protein
LAQTTRGQTNREDARHKRWEEDEIVLSDVIDFFASNWKFILLSTLVLSTVAVTLILLLPQQYNKQVTLNVTPVSTDTLVELGLSATAGAQDRGPAGDPAANMNKEQAGELTVRYLQNADLGEVDVSPNYNIITQWVEVVAQSRSRDALEDVGSTIVEVVEEGFQEYYETQIGSALETQLSQLERKIEGQQETLAQIERLIDQVPPTRTGGAENIEALTRLQALELRRVDTEGEIAANQNRRDDLQEALNDLPQRAAEPIVVGIMSESDVAQARSLVPVVGLVLLGSFVVTMILAIIRAAFRKGK